MMQTAMDIRMMAVADIPAVLPIQADCYTEIAPESDVSLHAKLSASLSTCFVVSIEDDTVGYRAVPPSAPLKAKHATYGEGVAYMERAL